MATKRPWYTTVLIAVGCLAGFNAITSSSPTLSASEIRDGAGFFSPAVVSSATEALNQVEQRDKVGVRIETFATIPADKLAEFQALPKSNWGVFYQKWIEEIARREKSKGLIVLITKSPGHLEFYVPPDLKQRGFGSSIQGEFSRKLLENFRNKQFDEGLTASVGYLNSVGPTFKASTAKTGYNPRPRNVRHQPGMVPGQAVGGGNGWGIWSWVILAVVIWLVFRVVVALVRGVSGGGMQGSGYGQPGYGGGGGFMSNMLGGLAGAMAGNWIYNSMFNSHSSAHGSDWGNSSDYGDSGGGDFGGGDFGGGDFGGGDFGGGDF
jgi:uncharacterized membrane protein YgcG